MANSENITLEVAEKLPLHGAFNNNWRQRRVFVHKHPTNDKLVVSVGYPMGGGDAVVCVENVDDYPAIASGYWRDYN